MFVLEQCKDGISSFTAAIQCQSTWNSVSMENIRRINRKHIFVGFVGLVVFALVTRHLFVSHASPSVSNPSSSPGSIREPTPANPSQSNLASEEIEGITGKLFSGSVIRKFPASKRRFQSFEGTHSLGEKKRLSPWCEAWAVMTTIFEPSESVRRQVKLKGWCLVIVADQKGQKEYPTGWVPGEGNDAVIYLTPQDQKSMHTDFIDGIPWNHFGRKNIGYLYAIMHGATIIWDFDDDNMLKFWIPDAAPKGAPSLSTAIPSTEYVENLEPKDHSWPTYNPYPILGAPTLPSWPRGLPLSDIKERLCSNSTLKPVMARRDSIAVLQSLAEYQPDVDAIFRITMPIPFSFLRSSETRNLMVPTGILTPYNAQATLHFEAGFYALILPITVHGRVSDIWRSYFAQRLFWDTGHQVGFMARALVVQDRNFHDNLGDLVAERDLYQKSKPLVDFLGNWRGTGKTVVERMEELYIALYERQYIELLDVKFVQLWLQSLIDAGYRFPKVKRYSVPVPKYPDFVAEEDKDVVNEASCTTNEKVTVWLQDEYLPLLGSTSPIHKFITASKDSSPAGKDISTLQRISPTLAGYTGHSTELTEKMVKENFEFYKNDEQIAQIDVFACVFPASMCELWMPFNKTIAFLPAHRYNLGRCTEKEWTLLNQHLQTMASVDNPKHIIGALSVYDQEYLRYYTGLDPLPLYDFASTYTTRSAYKPTREEVAIVSNASLNDIFARLKGGVSARKLQHVDEAYSYTDLASHSAIIYLPDSVVSHHFVELYSLTVPLFVPSLKFMMRADSAYPKLDRSSLTKPYCNDPKLDTVMGPHPRNTHPYSPNVESKDNSEDEYYWLQLADFLQWPFVTYFDDVSDLDLKLRKADFTKIHDLMTEEVEKRKEEMLSTWCRALSDVKTARKVPKDYSQALTQLYGVDRLQAS